MFRDGGTCLIRNDKQVGQEDPFYNAHFTDINGDETVRLIERFHAEGEPFFINVWWLVPHKPYEPAPEPFWSDTADDDISDDQHRFRSMVEHMDSKVGAIVNKLQELGIRENTILLFASDNGAAFEGQIGNLKGGKTDLHEGGIRVPMIVNWPGKVKRGITTNTLAHTNDLLPTLCAAAGVKIPVDADLDGISLLPHLLDQRSISDVDRGTLVWQIDLYRRIQRHYPKPEPYSTEIARRGKWKLLSLDGVPQELFDIEADITEKQNLLVQYPQVAEALADEVREFLAAPRQRDGHIDK